MGRKSLDLIGQRFGRLTVVCKNDERYDGRHTFWKCKCDCGNEIVVRKDSLLNGHSKSCGCYLQERYRDGHLKTHGMKNTRIYRTWRSMKDRCTNKNCSNYNRYGGRGITVCDEWKNDFKNFYNWAMENGYSDELTIDRMNVNGDYCPENCRWVSILEQNYNKRNNIIISVYGERLTIKEISEKYNIPKTKVRKRYYAGIIDEERLLYSGNLKSKKHC